MVVVLERDTSAVQLKGGVVWWTRRGTPVAVAAVGLADSSRWNHPVPGYRIDREGSVVK
jgi:hypothetical protein